MCVEYVSETHSNGMPKIIKTYNGYGKLELNKVVGYYSDGAKKYEKTYYNGKVKNIVRWNRDGKRVSSVKDWSNHERSQALELCLSENTSLSRTVCECMINLIISEFSYQEYEIIYQKSFYKPLDIDLQKRAEKVVFDTFDCID